jgi:hypothetical protein
MNNNFTDGIIKVCMEGDVNGDGEVNLKDVYAVGRAFGSTRGPDGLYWHTPLKTCCPHSPNCDLNDDGKIDLKDYYPTCWNFGSIDP